MLIEQGAMPPTRKLGCGFLPPKTVWILIELALPVERLEVVRDRHQVGFGRQLVGRVAPVAVGEGAELAALDECLEPLLHVREVRPARVRPVEIDLRQRGRSSSGRP